MYFYFFTLVSIFVVSIVFLIFKIDKLKSEHVIEIHKLQLIIDELILVHDKQKNNVVLSEHAQTNLQKSRTILDEKILELQKELINELSINNLIK